MGIRNKKGKASAKAGGSGSGEITGKLADALPSAGPVDGFTLDDSDFTSAKVKPKPQVSMLVFGDAGEGKTSIATMFGPQPVAYLNFDRRGRHAVYAAREAGRKILDVEIEHPSDLTRFTNEEAKKIAQKSLGKMMRNFEIAVRESQRGNVRSICLDTATELHDIISTAITGSTMAVKGDYGRSKGLINQQWWQIFDMAREGEAHLIVLARAKELWHANQPTGRMVHRGPEVIRDAVDLAGWIRLKKSKKAKKKGAPTKEFELEITKSGVNIGELGEVYTSEDWEELGGPFAYACTLQFEGTDFEDWQ